MTWQPSYEKRASCVLSRIQLSGSIRDQVCPRRTYPRSSRPPPHRMPFFSTSTNYTFEKTPEIIINSHSLTKMLTVEKQHGNATLNVRGSRRFSFGVPSHSYVHRCAPTALRFFFHAIRQFSSFFPPAPLSRRDLSPPRFPLPPFTESSFLPLSFFFLVSSVRPPLHITRYS